MYRLIALIGMICAVAGAGMLAVLLIALVNNQIPVNIAGTFLAIMPFFLLAMAGLLLSRHKG